MILVGVVLLPCRLVLMLIGLLGLWVTAKLRMLSASREQRAGMLPLKRPIIDFIFRIWARICLFSLGYWWVQIRDLRSDADKKDPAPILVANHVSFADSFLFSYTDSPMPVALASLVNAPIIGTFAQAHQAIAVARGEAAKENVSAEILRRTQWKVHQPSEVVDKYGTFAPLLIFPEGTCNNNSAVTQFKTGAFNPMMPVQPIAIDYRQQHLDVSWAGDSSPGLTILRMMCQVYNTVSVTYLPIEAPQSSTDTSAAFAARVRTVIASTLGVPATEHNHNDILLGREARKLRFPPNAVNVQMGLYPFGFDDAKLHLRRFAAADQDRDGLLNNQELATYLGLAEQYGRQDVETVKLVHRILHHIGANAEGKVSFSKLLLQSSAVVVDNGSGSPNSKSLRAWSSPVLERQQNDSSSEEHTPLLLSPGE